MWGANMAAEISSRGKRLFPEVRIQFRTAARSSQIALSPAVQASALTAVIVSAAALIYLGIGQIHYVRLVGDEKSAVARTEIANVNLQVDVADLRDRLAFSARDRAVAEDRLSALASQADALRRQLESTETRLHGLEQELSQREAQPPELAAEARPVEPAQAELAPSDPANREGSAPEISAEAARRAEPKAVRFCHPQGRINRRAALSQK